MVKAPAFPKVSKQVRGDDSNFSVQSHSDSNDQDDEFLIAAPSNVHEIQIQAYAQYDTQNSDSILKTDDYFSFEHHKVSNRFTTSQKLMTDLSYREQGDINRSKSSVNRKRLHTVSSLFTVKLNADELEVVSNNFQKECVLCNGVKPPRTHHCSKCGRCVMRMDHHCPWIGNCVGFKN